MGRFARLALEVGGNGNFIEKCLPPCITLKNQPWPNVKKIGINIKNLVFEEETFFLYVHGVLTHPVFHKHGKAVLTH